MLYQLSYTPSTAPIVEAKDHGPAWRDKRRRVGARRRDGVSLSPVYQERVVEATALRHPRPPP